MSRDLLNAALAEEQRLLRELEATPLFRRLEAVRTVLRAYQEQGNLPHHTSTRAPSKAQTARPVSLTSQVIDIAQEYLRQQQRRAQSIEILQVVQGRGIEVQGEKPSTIVASILSHSALFDNVRGQGYGLAEWTSAPQDGESGPIDSGGQVGDDQAGQTNRQDNMDNDTLSGLHSNGATNPDRPWPQVGS